MTSVLHPETALLWLLDEPDLMRRFCDVLALKMVELNTVLREFSGNQSKASQVLGIDRKTLYLKLRKYGLSDYVKK
jgi:transcriptional regulator of acetoin/glycerol metabolism